MRRIRGDRLARCYVYIGETISNVKLGLLMLSTPKTDEVIECLTCWNVTCPSALAAAISSIESVANKDGW
jgi:hypothetical protein